MGQLSEDDIEFLRERMKSLSSNYDALGVSNSGDCSAEEVDPKKYNAPIDIRDMVFGDVFSSKNQKDYITPIHKLQWVLDKRPDEVDAQNLRQYLVNNMSYVKNREEFTKVVCYLDWMENCEGENVKYILNYEKDKK